MSEEQIKAAKDQIVAATQLEREFLTEYRVSPDKDDMYMFHGESGFLPRIELSTCLSHYKKWLIFNGHVIEPPQLIENQQTKKHE